ncbi:MAG: hypothetical protein H0S80_05085 [Desulfovibrionaceae bacterium]|nr:hypothetical protein [Desulfovibrionaceae bacterium]
MHKAALTILAATALFFVSGCGNRIWKDSQRVSADTYDYMFGDAPTAVPYHAVAAPPLIEINHRAADVLSDNVKGKELSDYSAVYVTPFANQVDPGDKSVFGRVVSDQVADRLVQKDLCVTEGEPAGIDRLYVGGASTDDYRGLTSKDEDDLKPRTARLTGTYVIGNDFVYLSARITRLVDHTVVSAHNWTIPVSGNVRAMLPRLKNPAEGTTPTVLTQFE